MNHRGLIESADLIPQLLNVAARPGEGELGAGAIPVRPIHRAAVKDGGTIGEVGIGLRRECLRPKCLLRPICLAYLLR